MTIAAPSAAPLNHVSPIWRIHLVRWRPTSAPPHWSVPFVERMAALYCPYLKQERVRELRVKSVRRQERTNAAERRQVRVAAKGELLCKHLLLLLHNSRAACAGQERASVCARDVPQSRP